MAEAFGIVSGAVGIAGIFSTCLECFEYVQIGRHFGQDSQTGHLMLSGLKLRLSRWGEAVHLYTDPQLGHPEASPSDLQLAKQTLYQILVLMSDSEKVSKKFRLGAKLQGESSASQGLSTGTDVATIDQVMREQAKRRQKSASLVKVTSWALYSKNQLTSLVDDISKLLDTLEQTFPAPDARSSLAESEIREMCDRIQGQQDNVLKLAHDLSAGVDKALQAQATKMIEQKGISIGSMVATENSRVKNGNFVGIAWRGESQIPKNNSSMEINSIDARGNARVMNGDTYGDRDDFWD
ncbi:prion-inhibition and propagation-domain-containing protein [Aspergillus avenaceus]|uniref:Prion-inhibition and propagation-domain-containing protein n=1 Tax=Aspergillus avenaceus TaxID=36643 RepID=A0A5N6TJX0_ASPAV|nr:prion-inhibition and propagation-domain-containing protein [Aspergillus avenaceus]